VQMTPGQVELTVVLGKAKADDGAAHVASSNTRWPASTSCSGG
jgi:hypothetical protein